jgi:hypothetical protein
MLKDFILIKKNKKEIADRDGKMLEAVYPRVLDFFASKKIIIISVFSR